MKRLTTWPRIALAFSVLVAGCQGGTSPDASSAVPEQAPAVADAEVPVRLADWDEVERLIAAEHGKVVVLDVWSSWCVPCVREFPNLVALHRKHGGQVACISLNCNYTGATGEDPENSRPQVEAFLKKQGATFENVISTTPDQQLWETLDAAAVPIVRVYDKQGRLRKQFVDEDGEYGEEGFTYDRHIGPLVDELLKEEADEKVERT